MEARLQKESGEEHMSKSNGSGAGSGNGTRNGMRVVTGGLSPVIGTQGAVEGADHPNGELVDFSQVREQKIEEKRRKTERIFFKNLLAVYCVTATDAMAGVDLVDISEDGLAFQVRFDPRNPWPRDLNELPFRLYFSQDTYLEIGVVIQNSRQTIDGGARMVRYGCTIDKSWSSYATYLQFVRFLKLYAEHNHRDTGDTKIYYV